MLYVICKHVSNQFVGFLEEFKFIPLFLPRSRSGLLGATFHGNTVSIVKTALAT